jgi:hypothetical protein
MTIRRKEEGEGSNKKEAADLAAPKSWLCLQLVLVLIIILIFYLPPADHLSCRSG